MRLPSPVVLVGRDGNARLMNREYEQRYGPAAIDAASLPQPLAGAGGQVLAMPIRGRDGSIGQAQIMVVGGGQPLLKGV